MLGLAVEKSGWLLDLARFFEELNGLPPYMVGGCQGCVYCFSVILKMDGYDNDEKIAGRLKICKNEHLNSLDFGRFRMVKIATNICKYWLF